jgi:hypothetical protein
MGGERRELNPHLPLYQMGALPLRNAHRAIWEIHKFTLVGFPNSSIIHLRIVGPVLKYFRSYHE